MIQDLAATLDLIAPGWAHAYDPEMGLWAVTLDGDIIGSGEAETEALSDAAATARRWEAGR